MNDNWDGEAKVALRKIGRVFDVKALLNRTLSDDEITRYYTESRIGYRLLHSASGSIHMALNSDGKFDRSGYREQVGVVSQYVTSEGAHEVLELASGLGYNMRYLAEHHVKSRFFGIDLTPEHVKTSLRRKKSSNESYEIGNFENLPYTDASFDLLFSIESLCHGNDPGQALVEASRVLKPGGLLVIFDGFRTKQYSEKSDDIQTLCRLAEVAMAVKATVTIDEWLDISQRTGFKLEKLSDRSEEIVPNLLRLQRLAKGYFRSRLLARSLRNTLPEHLLNNAVAGLAMPITVGSGAHSYVELVLRLSS